MLHSFFTSLLVFATTGPAFSQPPLKVLDVDFMMRGYCYASSPYKKELAGYGGWASSSNSAKQIPEQLRFSSARLSIDITQKRAAWGGEYEGYRMYVANTSDSTFYFDAQDSRLELKLQAFDSKTNAWRDIEYLPNSWCGNSYHVVYLAPNEMWEFSVPRYNGRHTTRIRAHLAYKHDPNGETLIAFSNEIEGSINSGQFTKKRDYAPAGIMDPYDE